MLCRETMCKNRVGYITSSDVLGRRTGFKSETLGLVLRSQDCLDNQIEIRLCSLTSKAHRAPVQYHVTPLQITVAQRSGALFVRNTLSPRLMKFMNASCKGPKVM